MSRDFKVYLDDILVCVEKILEHTHHLKNVGSLERDSWMQDAIFRNLEIMGEAAKRIPDDFCARYPEIPWKEIKGTRDRLIHQYAEVSTLIIWDVIQNELPMLKENLKQVISEIEEGNSG